MEMGVGEPDRWVAKPTGVSEARQGLNEPPGRPARKSQRERERDTWECRRVPAGREMKKDRGRNAGPLAPSSPWLQSLRGEINGPQ